MAPHAVWPITSTTLAPANLQANSMLPKDVRVSDVARDPAVKNVADSKVHDDLGRGARIDACQQHRRRVLSLGACFLFAKVIAVLSFAHAKALVAVLHCLNDLFRCQLIAQLLRKSVRACSVGREDAATGNSDDSRRAGHLEKIPAAQAIAGGSMFKLL